MLSDFRKFLFFTIIINLSFTYLAGEGTPELAPNKLININGNTTNDIAALYISDPSYNNFAKRRNPDPQARLYINIQDPENECIILGFSKPRLNNSDNFLNVDIWLVDPNGKDVFGPFRIDSTNYQIEDWD